MKEVTLRVVFKKLLPSYETIDPFHFLDFNGKEWTVPACFPTDGASFPWWLKYVGLVIMIVLLLCGADVWTAFSWAVGLQSLIGAPLHSAYADAAVAHDYLYWLGAPKAFADCVFFRLILRRANVLRWMYLYEHQHWVFRAIADVVIAYRYVRAFVMYGGVALGGFAAYAAHRRRRRRANALAVAQ